MKVLAVKLLLVVVTAAQWNGGEPISKDPPPPGGLMSGQIGGRSVPAREQYPSSDYLLGNIRSVQIKDRQFLSPCTLCKSVSDAERVDANGI